MSKEDKGYLDFVERMGSFEFEVSLEDIGQDNNIAHSNHDEHLSMTLSELQHYGVKGMKWGVRRTDAQLSRARAKIQNGVKRIKDGVQERSNSIKRERSWSKILDNIDGMSDAEVKAISNRIQLENDFKRLTKGKDQKAYRNREKLSNTALNDVVKSLRARDQLTRNVNEASKGQRDFGKKVVGLTGPFLVTAALRSRPELGAAIAAATAMNRASKAVKTGDGVKLQKILNNEFDLDV